MTSEEIGFAFGKIFDAGAVDVFTVPAMMKKSRPAVILHVLCREDQKNKVIGSVFKYTTTIGIRECVMDRYILDRKEIERETPYGTIREKRVSGYGVDREKYEFDDLAAAAEKAGISLRELRDRLNG